MPETNERTPGLCAGFEESILDDLDGALDSAQRQHIEAHLAGCASCHDFRQRQQALDNLLSSHVRCAALPTGFKELMLQRTRVEAGNVSTERPAEEDAPAMNRLPATIQKRFRCELMIAALDGLSVGAVAIVLSFALTNSIQVAMASLVRAPDGMREQFVPFVFAIVAVAVGLGIAFKGRISASLENI